MIEIAQASMSPSVPQFRLVLLVPLQTRKHRLLVLLASRVLPRVLPTSHQTRNHRLLVLPPAGRCSYHDNALLT